MLRANDRESYLACYRVFATADAECAPLYATLPMPVLAITGADDAGSTPAMSAAIAAACPRGEVAIVPGARHLLPLDAPQAVADAIVSQRREGLMATVALKQYQHYIGGEWVDAAEGATFESFNPATGEPWYRAARGSAEDMQRAVAAAKTAFEDAGLARPHRRRAAATCVRQARRPDRRERRAPRGRRVDRQRQADPRDARAAGRRCPSTTGTSPAWPTRCTAT